MLMHKMCYLIMIRNNNVDSKDLGMDNIKQWCISTKIDDHVIRNF